MARRALSLLLSISLTACAPTAPPDRTTRDGSSPSAAPSATAEGRPPASVEPPAPQERLPPTAAGLAARLLSASAAIDAALPGWVAGGARLGDPRARVVSLNALLVQRIYRALARSPRRYRNVLRLLPRPRRSEVRNLVGAGRSLFAISGVSPRRPRFRLAAPEPPAHLRRYFVAAQRRFGVPWQVLGAVNFVESKFGRILGPSSAGALGPMQFLPATWEAYGAGGDILDPRDSIVAAARYLQASGAPRDLRGALLAYNPTPHYVDAILRYARAIRHDERAFYVFYFWQVFVVTEDGDLQLTGPGSRRGGV